MRNPPLERPSRLGIRRIAAGACGALFGLATFTAGAQTPEVNEVQVRALLLSNGYSDVESVVFEDGLWTASADAPDSGRVTVHVHPASDRVYRADATPSIAADTVTERLAQIGWEDVHAPRFEDGVWKVEAENTAGQELLLYIDPDDGALLGSRSD